MYARGYSFNLDDMFLNFRHKRLKLTCDESERYFNDRHKKTPAKQILTACVKMVLDDVLENNVTFKLPGCQADIHMHAISGEDFQRARNNGAFQNVDFLKSNFTAYRPYLFLYSFGKTRMKQIRTKKYYTEKIDEYTNNGKTYC